MFRRI